MSNPAEHGRRTIARRGGIMLIAAMALLVSGCSGPEDLPSVLASGSADEKETEPKSEPIAFGAKPLWDKNSRGDYAASGRGFTDSRVLGDRVVHGRLDEDADSHLTVADAETGEPKWTLTETDPIPGSDGLTADFLRIHPLGDSAKAKALIIVYSAPATLEDGSSGVENGIAALSVKTGEMLWHAPVVTGREYHYNVFIDASSSDYVAISVSDVDDDSDLDDLALVSTGEHKVLWRKANLVASGIVAGTVLAAKPVEKNKSAKLLALDAANGDERWDRDKDDDPEVLELTPEAVIASVSGAVAVIDPKSGDTVAGPKISATDCHFDGKSTVACQAKGDNDEPLSAINTVTLSDGSAKARQVPKSDTYSLTGMYRGRIFAEKWSDKRWNYHAIGTDGGTLADELPGRLVDTSDHYAVFTFRNSDGSDTMTVHEVEV